MERIRFQCAVGTQPINHIDRNYDMVFPKISIKSSPPAVMQACRFVPCHSHQHTTRVRLGA